jgi:hypothetical protein
MMRVLILFPLLVCGACNEQKKAQSSNPQPVELAFSDYVAESLARSDSLVFRDLWEGIGTSRQNIEIEIISESKLIFRSWAYNIVEESCDYSIDGHELIISPSRLKENWPVLVSEQTDQGFRLNRKDGKRSFSEHWNIYQHVIVSAFPLVEVVSELDFERQADKFYDSMSWDRAEQDVPPNR